jgi:CRISPR system Cascade subunit CasA
MSDLSFNLMDEPWIPCCDLAGNYLTLGIRDLLLRSHELRSIQHQNPLTEVALLRILLAAIHRAVDGPRNSNDWKMLYKSGQFDERITKYLDKWRHRFDLFSSDEPFYQTPELMVVDSGGSSVPQPICSLMLERSSGNNKTLFDHTFDSTPVKLQPATAAHALITAQMFSLSGLNKKTTNIFGYQQSFLNSVMVSGIFIVLTGSNLFRTLLLNLLVYRDNEPIPYTSEDCPVWESHGIGKSEATTPKGYLDFLTCKCRHIRLLPQQDGDSVCVEYMHIAQGEAFPDVTNPGFFKKKKKDESWYYPQLDINRMVWRDSMALFSFDENVNKRPKAFRQIQAMRGVVTLPDRFVCMAYAIANEKGNPLAWRKEKLNVPLSLLADSQVAACMERGMRLSEKGATALDGAVKCFMRKVLPDKSKDVAEKASATGAVRMYWDQLEKHFQRFLLDIDDPETALEKWENSLKQTARDSLNLCVNGRYRGNANSYRAWTASTTDLNIHLAKLRD